MKNNSNTETIKKAKKPMAFVLGKYLTGGLGVVRNLGRKNIPVIWINYKKNYIGYYSKYCRGITSPHPRYKPHEYVDFLIKIGEQQTQKGVLIPIGDIELQIILENEESLQKYYHIINSKFETTKILLNKKIFYETLQKYDIPHPKTFFPENTKKVKEIQEKINFPCIVKPIYSAPFVLDFKTKLFQANNKEELIHFFQKSNSRNHEMIIQEIIPGDAKYMYGLNAYYDKNFKPRAVFMYNRIREWPQGFGNGCFIQKADIPQIQEITNLLMEKIKYFGIIDAEFKKDPRDNRYKLIEINPRCWMQNSLPTVHGANLPYIAYMDAIGQKLEQQPIINKDSKWVFMLEDIQSSLYSISKKELSFKDWINSHKGKKEYAIFSKDDPLPFLIFLAKSIFTTLPFLIKKHLKN
jgi:predicted ATP-grasp superfamily ATP-dependent carboligase